VNPSKMGARITHHCHLPRTPPPHKTQQFLLIQNAGKPINK
jgi:hypothetical protein